MTEKKPKDKKKKKPKLRKPSAKIDWDIVGNLCKIRCTVFEILSVIDIAPETLYKRCIRDNGITFTEFSKKYSAQGIVSVRRRIFKNAIMEGKSQELLYWHKTYAPLTDDDENPAEKAKESRDADSEIAKAVGNLVGELASIKAESTPKED